MIAMQAALEKAWWGVGVHLWQTTIVLVPIVALAWLARGGSGRVRGFAWGAALLKLLLPFGAAASAWALVAPVRELVVLPAFSLAADVLVPQPAAMPAPASWPVPLTIAWLLGTLLLAVRFARALRSDDVPVSADAELLVRLAAAACEAGLDPSRVRVVRSGAACVRGVVRPLVDVPERLVRELEPEALRALLLHEGAHVVRREPLRELGLRLVLLAFWFYPPAWMIARGLRSAAEIDCDERALARGAGRDRLGEALAMSVRLGLAGSPASMASRRPRSLLRERFRRLDEAGGQVSPLRSRLAAAAALLVACVAVLLPAMPAAARAALPILDTLVAPPVRVDPKSAGVAEGGEIVALVDVAVGADGAVQQVTAVHVRGDLPTGDAEQLEEAARQVASQMRFAAEGRGSTAVVEMTWQVGTSLRLGAGPARVEATEQGARAIVPAPQRITSDMTPPVLAKRVNPEYPEDAKALGATGIVVVEAVIGTDGAVADARILKGAPDMPSIDEATLAAIRQWVYSPATKDGVPVPVMLVIRVNFRLGAQQE